MKIVIPMDGRVRTILHTPFLIAKRETETTYSLQGETLQMSGITADQVLILQDSIQVENGQTITHDLQMLAQPLEAFVSLNAENALAEALALVLRSAVADGRVTDEELIRVAPALEGRLWQLGLSVQVGDVYSFGAFLWRCVQAHITQGDWSPDLTPALWRKVEILHEDTPRVWENGIDYIVGDEVAYPDENSPMFTCLQAHTAQMGWEPNMTPALWHRLDATSGDRNGTGTEQEIEG